MDINELESFKLSDAVKFNKTLNPRLWGRDEHLLPEVREKLMAIADDFREFLGVDGLDVKDVTVSGSNAAYTYTPHSDIDLHLVVNTPDGKNSDVYRELFDAKKYQYNDQHNYKIGGYDVELYVQDADQVHHSQGIYSLSNNDWVSVPRRRRPEVDDMSVRSKFEDIGHRIEQAVASGDPAQLEAIAAKVKHMRQAGLDSTGEFGPENLAFKALRTQGLLDQLSTARSAVKDQELSIAEQQRQAQEKKPKSWGKFGGMWFPGLGYYTSTKAEDPESFDDGVETVAEQKDIKQVLQPFVDSCVEYLDIEQTPKIILKHDPEWTRRNGTFGRFDPDTYSVTLAVSGRHVLDILRTLAHELTHARQDEQADMPVDAGETGSPYEDEANAMAGRIMRHWVDEYPEFFKDVPLEESVKDKLAAVATAACVAGTPGCATTGADAIRTVQDVGRTAQTIKHMGRAGAEEELMQRLKNELRRRQGQVVPEAVTESLDHPYKILRWEKGDHGDVDAIARLDDGTFLSIMFNKGFKQETKEEAWSVEFFRNNSQEKTGEGDQQRVFATVLSAVETFISDRVPGAKGKYKPNKIYFSASKEVKPDEDQRKAMTRARLYDSLVQRYARALGFRAFRADTGKQVMYELSRIKPVVAEATGYIPVNDKEARDPRYSMAITQDIKPGEVQRQARKMGWTTDAAGRPPLLTSNASNLREFQDSNMKIAHILKEATLGGFPVKVLHIQDQGVNEFALPGGDDREPDEEAILRQLAAQWWLGTEQEMSKAQKTLAAMGWDIGQDESGDDDAGVFVIRAGDENGDSYIAFNHSELEELNEAFNNYHANRTGFKRGARDPEGQDPQASQQVWGLKINGKVWSKQGKDVTFTNKQAAINSMNAILKNRPDLQGKIGLVTRGGVAEGLNEFAPGAGGDDGDADPYRYPKPTQFNRSVDYFGQFEADHFDREDFDDTTGVFKGYWGNTQIAYFKFDNPAKTGSDDPGMGWYYEPESDSPGNSTSASTTVDNSEERKKQELNMINAFLKSGLQPKPGSQIYSLMKRHGLTEGSVAKKPQPYNEPGWAKKLPKEKLDAIAGPRYKDNKNKKDVKEAIKLNAPQKSWSKQDMQDYLTRIKTGTKTKQDRFKPIIHGSNVKAITKDDGTEEWDLEDLKRQITTPPRAILGSNAKMSKSKKEGAITYDLTLPALSGIVVDEDTGEFVEITTCPGAGECQLFCYARKGGYVMFPAASMSAAQALNFLVNHPDEYMAMFDTEIKKTKALADKNGIKLLVRIHDAGDFFSKEYWDLSKKVQLNNPDVRFYFYSKMGDPVTDPNTPSNTLPNFSDGGAKSREVKKVELYRNAGKNLKGAPTIPKDMFRDLFVTDAKGKYVKDEQGRTQVKSPEAWENFKQKLSTKYNIDPGSIITYDQMNRIPEGPKPKWNVVVFPAGHGDLGATRLDVQNQFLMFH